MNTLSEWNIRTLEAGGHQVRHQDHEAGGWTEVGTFGPEMTLGDLVALLIDQAADGDFILLPDGSPVVILDVPEEEATSG